MRIDGLQWTPDRVEHIARHGITPMEVEEIFASSKVFRRGRGGVYEAWAGRNQADACS
ncbi:MAG: hypothetical protein ACRD2O_03875 [Terriglobia bacterium]